MAVCKRCHRTIPDGREFCEDCEIKNKMTADESYLDSLLSSVMKNEEQPRREKQEKNDENKSDMAAKPMSDFVAPKNEAIEPAPEVEAVPETEPVPEDDNSDMDELLSSLFGDEVDGADEEAQEVPEMLEPDDISAIFDEAEQSALAEDEILPEIDIPDISESVEEALGTPEELEIPDMAEEPEVPEIIDTAEEPEVPEIPDLTEESEAPEMSDIPEASEMVEVPEEDVEPELPDISDIVDAALEKTEEIETSDIPDVPDIPDIPDIPDVPEVPDIPDVPESEASAAPLDVMATGDDVSDVSALLGLGPDEEQPDMVQVAPNPTIHPSDASEFGDADDLMNAFEELPSEDGGEEAVADGDIDSIMDSINSGEFESELSTLSKKGKKKKDDKKKGSWFERLFYNIKEERTPEQEAARIEKLKAEEEKKKTDAEEAKKKKALTKEEKKAKAEQDKAAKAEAAAKAKAEKDAAAKAKKEAAALKAKKKKEAKLAIDEYEDEGKINKTGASILVILFAVLTVAVILGTNIYTYKLSIDNAQTDFDRQRYNDAYYDVYGLEIKDEDIVLYDRIMTVMYVNKQLNSYNNYKAIGNTDKALDSLLKGLQRYDKYIQLASILDIVDDLNFVKEQIVNELNTEFSISEAQAEALIATDEIFDYSDYIYGVTDLKGSYDY